MGQYLTLDMPLLHDSVFTSHLKFADDLLMPIAQIEAAQQRVEDVATAALMAAIQEETQGLLLRAEVALGEGDVAAINMMRWPLAGRLARAIVGLWGGGFDVGAVQGLEEMRSAVEYVRPFLRRFALADDARRVFDLEPQQLINTDAVDAVMGRANMLAGDFSEDIFGRLRQDLIAAIVPQAGTGEPISRGELLLRIQGTLGVAQTRGEAIIQTELTYSYNTGRLSSFNQSDLVDYIRVIAIADARTSEICKSRNGLILPKGELATIGGPPPWHVRCIPGDTRINLDSKIVRVSKRFADTELVVIRTAADHTLACTPNHPILTDRGWILAKDIYLGCQVFSDIDGQWESFCDGDDQNVPSTIEEIAESFIKNPSVVAVEVPVTAPDFHGDGVDGEVAVIYTDLSLVPDGEAEILKHFGQRNLSRACPQHVSFNGFGSLKLFFNSLSSLRSRFVSFRHKLSSAINVKSIHSCLLLLRSISSGIAVVLEKRFDSRFSAAKFFSQSANTDPLLVSAANDITQRVDLPVLRPSPLWDIGLKFLHGSFNRVGINIKFPGQLSRRLSRHISGKNFRFGYNHDTLPIGRNAVALKDRVDPVEIDAVNACDILDKLSGLISPDYVQFISRRKFSGHVYNLHTQNGYYAANNIVTSNCRTTISPVMSQLSRFKSMVADPANDPSNRAIAPLPKGWRTTGAAAPPIPAAPEAVPDGLSANQKALYQAAIDGKPIPVSKAKAKAAQPFLADTGTSDAKVDRLMSGGLGITKDEAHATAQYIGGGYSNMSKRVYAPNLAIDPGLDNYTKAHVDTANELFNNALRKMPPVTEAKINELAALHPSAVKGRAPELYDSSRGLTRGIRLDGKALDDLVEKHQSALTKGQAIREDSWFATTTMDLKDVDVAKDSNVVFRVRPRLDGTGQGRYIDHYKNQLVEGEVMYPAFSKFDVTDIRVTPGTGTALSDAQQQLLKLQPQIKDYQDSYGGDWKEYWKMLEPGKPPTAKQLKEMAEAADIAANYKPPFVEIFLRE